MNHRVVITGLGICSAMGKSPDEVRQRLLIGESGIGEVRAFDAGQLVMNHAGEVDNFDLSELFPAERVRLLDRGTQLAIYAARQSLEQAGIWPLPDAARGRTGIAVGFSGSGQYQSMRYSLDRQYPVNKLAGFYHQRTAPHFQTEEIARLFGIHGPHTTISSASAGSAIAIGSALQWLRRGKADILLAGGGECHTVLNAVGMDSLGLTLPEPCSPFTGPSGMTFGEGAAFLVLETAEHAHARNAEVLLELCGFAATSDGYDPIQFDPSGDGMYRVIQTALADAQVRPADVDWIRASGTGHREQDVAETLAIKRVFGQQAPPVSSTEPYFGHANGASPALGMIAAVLCQRAGIIPATLNRGAARPGCDLDYVGDGPRKSKVRTFVCNAAAFGGFNAALVCSIANAQTQRRTTKDSTDDIVISGVGLVSPLGFTTDEFLAGLGRQTTAVRSVERFNLNGSRSTRAALVPKFSPRRLLPTINLRRADLLTQYAAVAVSKALQDAKLDRPTQPERIGLVCGLSRPPAAAYERLFDGLCQGYNRPTLGRQLLSSGRFMVTSQLSHWFHCKGYTATLSEGITGGLHALIHAFEQLRQDDSQDAIVVVAADDVASLFFRLTEQLGVLAPDGKPAQLYDESSHGMVLGEGAVAMILERGDHVRRRHAPIGARVSGYGLTFDAQADACVPDPAAGGRHVLDPSGRWLCQAIELALEESGLAADDIDLILGHGRGIPASDLKEISAFARVFGGNTPVCCVNGNLGVADASCGLFSVAAAMFSMQLGNAYPVANCGTRSKAINLVRRQTLSGDFAHTLVAGSTETGNNAAVVLTRDESLRIDRGEPQ